MREVQWIKRLRIIDSTTVSLFSNVIFKGVGRHPKTGKKNAKTAFLKAMNNGWLPFMTWLKPLPLGKISKWTREAIIEESKKYTSRT